MVLLPYQLISSGMCSISQALVPTWKCIYPASNKISYSCVPNYHEAGQNAVENYGDDYQVSHKDVM